MSEILIRHFHIAHNALCLPPKILHVCPQEKLKTMLNMQNSGGQTKCIMGNVEMANMYDFVFTHFF